MKTFNKLLFTGCIVASVMVTSAYAAKPGSFGETNFNASLTLYSSIKVQKVADLNFGDVLMGGAKNVVVNSNSAGVAKFNASGDRNARVIAGVVEKSIKISNGGKGSKNEIVVDDWNYGGNVDGSGKGAFDVNGSLTDIRVGGVAHVKADTEYGNFSGTATLRVTYV
ncbi:MAG: DUF4402 domain-containing protein [Coxiellaceae bacterium]|nr:DUF4402 domain-containing protein [Coxiellaceae bacterium]